MDMTGICQRLGHSGEYGEETCGVCGNPAQYVRVEVDEGRAYTYKAFEDVPLTKGDVVVLPSNMVQDRAFEGTVLRVLDGPDPSYPGPFKSVLRRAEQVDPLL